MSVHSVLFDLDGTISDPKEGITLSLCHALERMGRPRPDPDSLAWCIGPPLQASLPQILGTDDPAQCARALELYRERFSAIGLFENHVYEGMPEVLAELKAARYAIYVATSKPTVYAERILEHFGLLGSFDGVYGSDLDGTRTRKGDLIKHVLGQEGLGPADAVMIGDREHDVRGALENGMPCIGVLYGYGDREELLAAGAVGLVERPCEIIDAVLGRRHRGGGRRSGRKAN